MYGTDYYRNERVSGNEETVQPAGGTVGRFPQKGCPTRTGQMIGRTRGVSGSENIEEMPAKLQGQRPYPLFQHRREILLSGNGYSGDIE